MTKLIDRLVANWQDTANFILGAWLAASPWILGYATDSLPTQNAVVVGAIIAVAAAAALYAFRAWEEWLSVALAAWLIASPWLLSFGNAATPTFNQFVVGVLVGILALWSTTIEHGPKNMISKH